MSRHELIYHDLCLDCSYVILSKIFINHNLEFLLQMYGHLNRPLCYALVVSGESTDVLVFFFFFDMTVMRLVFQS